HVDDAVLPRRLERVAVEHDLQDLRGRRAELELLEDLLAVLGRGVDGRLRDGAALADDDHRQELLEVEALEAGRGGDRDLAGLGVDEHDRPGRGGRRGQGEDDDEHEGREAGGHGLSPGGRDQPTPAGGARAGPSTILSAREEPPGDAVERWSIDIQKEYFKFSAAHFLIFPDGTAERLHGHNYRVFVSLEAALSKHGLVLDFKRVKPVIRELLDELDEHWLVPGEHDRLKVARRGDGTTEVRFAERYYAAPDADVLV